MTNDPVPHTHLFALRLWAEAVENGRFEWRGRVHHVPTGDVHYFREWQTLIRLIQQMLPEIDVNQASGADDLSYGGMQE